MYRHENDDLLIKI